MFSAKWSARGSAGPPHRPQRGFWNPQSLALPTSIASCDRGATEETFNASIVPVYSTVERNKDKCQRSSKLVGPDVRGGEACMFRDALRFCGGGGGGGGGGGVCFIIGATVFAGQDESFEDDAHYAIATHVCLARSFPF